jgi:hypothetical protein
MTMQNNERFEVIYKNQTLPVEVITLAANTLFRVSLIEKISLIITRAMGDNGKKFWTSIPEGRQVEAEAIGPLIEAWYRDNQQ